MNRKTILVGVAALVIGFGLGRAGDFWSGLGKGGPQAPADGAIQGDGETALEGGGPMIQNDALPGTPGAPAQSEAVEFAALPKEAVALKVSGDGFEPNNFSVRGGGQIVLGLASSDGFTHRLKFRDPSLRGVLLGVIGGQTRTVTFTAPPAGRYEFFDDLPGREKNSGVMVVK